MSSLDYPNEELHHRIFEASVQWDLLTVRLGFNNPVDQTTIRGTIE